MAVYTEIGDEELDRLLADYDIGAANACKGIAEGVENSNFLLSTDQGLFILTLYEKRVQAADLPWFLGLLTHLSGKGYPCPLPLRRRDGGLLSEAAGKPAAIVGFLNGRWPRRPRPVHAAAVGAALARLHLAGGDFTPPRRNALSLDAWQPLLARSGVGADRVVAGLHAALSAELAALATAWPEGLPSGVIHADLFPDNVFFVDGRLSGVIDFYFACTDAYAYDLAICLNAWCFEVDGGFNITMARQMLSGYRAVRPLTRAEFEALPVLARGAAMRFLLTRLHDWLHHPAGALVTPKDPLECLARLKFHCGVSDASAYGLDF